MTHRTGTRPTARACLVLAGLLIGRAASAHGDGGFSDNLGIMPLLARGVQNLLVFVNICFVYNHPAGKWKAALPVPAPAGRP